MPRPTRYEIELTVHPQPGGPTTFRLKGLDFSIRQPDDVKVQTELPAERYREIYETLGAIDVWSWQGEYVAPGLPVLDVLDGLCWELRTKAGSRIRKAEGCNAYPPDGAGPGYSEEFRTLLDTFLRLGEEVLGRPLDL
jgi:hypothetical protein